MVGGSDSHTPLQIGAIKTKMGRECCNVTDIKEAIKNNCDVTNKIISEYIKIGKNRISNLKK